MRGDCREASLAPGEKDNAKKPNRQHGCGSSYLLGRRIPAGERQRGDVRRWHAARDRRRQPGRKRAMVPVAPPAPFPRLRLLPASPFLLSPLLLWPRVVLERISLAWINVLRSSSRKRGPRCLERWP